MRRRRAAAEYPTDVEASSIDAAEAQDAVSAAADIVADARRLLQSAKLGIFPNA